MQAIAELAGVAEEDRRMIFAWSNMMTGIDDPEFGGDFGAATTASAEMMQ